MGLFFYFFYTFLNILYRVCHLKRKPNNHAQFMDPMYWVVKTLVVTFESMSPWLLGCCCRHLRRNGAGGIRAYSREKRVSVLEHHFALELFAAVRETFSNLYFDTCHL